MIVDRSAGLNAATMLRPTFERSDAFRCASVDGVHMAVIVIGRCVSEHELDVACHLHYLLDRGLLVVVRP